MDIASKLSTLQQEWICLQNQYDSYEKYSLLIKIFNIGLTSILLFSFNNSLQWCLLICSVLWLQDGIWKTFQSRIGQRLSAVENELLNLSKGNELEYTGMQFNSKWEQSRPGVSGLIFEYIRYSLKPTVIFPHALLLLLIIVQGITL